MKKGERGPVDLDSIKSEHDIDRWTAKALRKRAGLNQEQFWLAAGVSQSSGCIYEAGKTQISPPVKKLVFAIYAAGLVFDSSSPDGALAIRSLAQLQANKSPGGKAETRVSRIALGQEHHIRHGADRGMVMSVAHDQEVKKISSDPMVDLLFGRRN